MERSTASARIDVLEPRLMALAGDLLAYDDTARHPGNRELWRGKRNAPLPMVKRYMRLCSIMSRYRTTFI